jgi:hypothetical protein
MKRVVGPGFGAARGFVDSRWVGAKGSGTGFPLLSSLQGSRSRQGGDRPLPPGHGRRRGRGGHCDLPTLHNLLRGISFVYIRVLGRYPDQDELGTQGHRLSAWV